MSRCADPLPANQCPPATAASRHATPKTLGPPMVTFPARPRNIHTPITSAIGMVLPMVNTPQGLAASAFTTTIPSPASVTSRMNSTSIIETTPANRPISVRATSDSDRPLCRTDATSTTKSCTAPASTAPVRSQR